MRPIIFSTDMVRAIREGRKTMTRRVIKPQLDCRCDKPDYRDSNINWTGDKLEGREGWFCHNCGAGLIAADEWSSRGFLCPYGQAAGTVGLWVRETHYKYGFWVEYEVPRFPGDEKGRLSYMFGPFNPETRYYDNPPVMVATDKKLEGWFKRPSIHMFREDARLFLEITEVRVERLNQMTESDAHLEGVDNLVTFMLLWDRLNKKRGYEWKSNPWVWILTFKLGQ